MNLALDTELAARIWKRDLSIWPQNAEAQRSVANRLGWLTAPHDFHAKIEGIEIFANQVFRDYSDVVVLGMGGSSLCVEVMRDVFAKKGQRPKLHVLDSTHPGAIRRIRENIEIERTLFIVASKSGTTLESDSLFRYFWQQCEGITNPGGNFCAITDPDTVLSKLAYERDFVQVFTNPADIGGRFSALSYFGLVPAAILGVDLHEFLRRAQQMAHESTLGDSANSPLVLGSWLARSAQHGRNKMLLVADPRLNSFGYWAEQLVAESTGKEGHGILPVVVDGPKLKTAVDTILVDLSMGGTSGAIANGNRLDLGIATELDLGAEFFRWEFATAVCGALMGINPFDEPNVAEAKTRTNSVLLGVESGVDLIEVSKSSTVNDIHGFINQNLKPDGYIALLAFVDPSPLVRDRLMSLRDDLERKYNRPVTVGFGPRFLHSTGQLHKGGPANGVYIQFVDDPESDPAVPGKSYGFRTLIRAQALGDYHALADKGRPILSVDLGKDPAAALEALQSSAIPV
jgi:glucose-6-phosphate isomerase